RRHPGFKPYVAERFNLVLERWLRIVVPGDCDHVVRQVLEMLGVLNAHIAPEKDLAMVGAQVFVDLPKVIYVDAAVAEFLDLCLGPALAQLKSLIGPDMEERSRKDGSEVCKHFSDESEGGRSSGREHVAVRDFDHILELLILKRQV